MILLHSGASMSDAPQVNVERCLGGYVSSTGMPNGRLDNLFSTISKSDILNKRSIIRMICLKNTTGAKVTGVKIYTTTTGSHVKLQVAAVAPAVDSNGKPIFESVIDAHAMPYQATLDYHEGIDNAIDVGDIEAGGLVGIWIQREIDQSKFPEFNTTATGAELAEIIKASANNTGEEAIQLNISWN